MLSERLGWTFSDPTLLERALAHRSWCAEHADTASNERLEFLGDAVLGMVVTDQLFARYPDCSEGWLSRARSMLVRAGTLYDIACELSIGEALLLGKGEHRTGGRTKPSILADAVEAVIGAVYLDGGMEAARQVVLELIGSRMEELVVPEDGTEDVTDQDPKSRLQECCARGGGDLPVYAWSESGPEHAKTFTVDVKLHGHTVATGSGASKKQAEQAAAALALNRLELSSSSGVSSG